MHATPTRTHTHTHTGKFTTLTGNQVVVKLRMPELRALLSASMLCTTWPEPKGFGAGGLGVGRQSVGLRMQGFRGPVFCFGAELRNQGLSDGLL